MENTSWIKQTDQPAFPDVLWSLPEIKNQRGRVLLIGGSGQQFSAVNQAFAHLTSARIGYVDIAVPESLQGIIPSDPSTYFLTSTKTNTIAKEAAGELRRLASQTGAVFICGDIGRSSQTSQALGALLISSNSPITITLDAVDAFASEPHVILDRANTVIVLSFGQLQRLLGGKTNKAITSDMGLVLLVQTLQRLQLKATIVLYYEGAIIASTAGDVSTTKVSADFAKQWRLKTAAFACVIGLQHQGSQLEAITTAVHLATKAQ